jgi:hypothetical protein
MSVEINDERPLVKINARDNNKVIVQEVNNQVKITGWGPQGATGPIGPIGPQGPQGESGQYTISENAPTANLTQGDLWFRSSTAQLYFYYDGYWIETSTSYAGPVGATGATGATGASANLTSVTTDILPSVDNTYVLGNSNFRWKSLSVGSGTIYITDSVTSNTAALTIANGIFFINGVAQAQLPNVRVTNLTFNDNTTQTTAAVAQVNSDWNATSGKAQILNKPDILTLSAPTPTAYSPVFSSAGGSTQIAFTGTPATGSYMKQGKLVTFRIRVAYTTMTAFGSGNGNQYYITLPFAPVADYVFRDSLYEKSSNGNHYELSAHASANSTTMSLWHSAGSGNENPVNHTYPTAPATADYFYLSGTYEATT